MLNYLTHTVRHDQQRYNTVGDWVAEDNKLKEIFVSDMQNEDYEFLVALHELVEAWLCLKRGIGQNLVDAFDIAYEKNRQPGDNSEPGDYIYSPYLREHRFATKVEKMLAKQLKVDWDEYGKVVNSL